MTAIQEPQFDNCWADTEPSRCEVIIGPTTFRLRCLTAGEAARVTAETRIALPPAQKTNGQERLLYARSLGKEPDDLTPIEADEFARLVSQPTTGYDGARILILTVAAALGAWRRYGDEGWSDQRTVTIEAVSALREEVMVRLYRAYQDTFRPIGSAVT